VALVRYPCGTNCKKNANILMTAAATAWLSSLLHDVVCKAGKFRKHGCSTCMGSLLPLIDGTRHITFKR